MQVIQPLLGLSKFPLGIVKNFDLSNRLLLKQDSNFQLGLKNAIQPLGASSGVGLQTKSPCVQPLVNRSKLLLPRQDKAVIDEKVWNSENWDINEFTTFSTYELEKELENELETDIFLSQEEKHTSYNSDFNSNIDSIENPFTTIITDLLPSNNQSNFDTHIENESVNINNANIETNNIHATSDVRREENILEQLPKKTKSKSKDTSIKKSRTKKSSNKKSHNLVANNIQSSHNEMSGDTSVKQHLSEAENILQENQYIPAIAAQQVTHHSENNDDNTDVYLKEIQNQKSIFSPEETTLFQGIEESNNIEEKTLESDLTVLDNNSINQSINQPPIQKDNSSVIEGFQNQENLAIDESNSQVIPELLLQMSPDILESSNFLEKQNSFDDLSDIPQNISHIPQKQITDNSSIQAEYKQHNSEPNKIENKSSLDTEASDVGSTEIINTIYTSEAYVNTSENSETTLLPIIQTASENEITENQLTIIKDNHLNNQISNQEINSEAITKDISPLPNVDSVIQKITPGNLEVDNKTDRQINHPVQSANSDTENTNTQNIVTNLIGHQQIESAEMSSNDSNKETSRGDELDNLEVDHETHHQINHPLQSANPDAENTNTQNIVTNLIEHQQIESAEMLSNDSNKETSRGDELDNLEVDHETNHQINHPLQSANLDAENTNTQNIVTNLIGHQQIEYAEISSNYSDKETSRYDALEDITVIQRNTQQDDSISQVVDDIKLNFTANNTPSNIPTENIKARKENVENTSIELKK
ncbi:MAG: hypothetical protein HC785_15025 [Calothrix sp. CSU_2_0]|nr:hypothetical protein [Calothrix sp. CSU_2_0]